MVKKAAVAVVKANLPTVNWGLLVASRLGKQTKDDRQVL